MFMEGSRNFTEASDDLRDVLGTLERAPEGLRECPQVLGNAAEGFGNFSKVEGMFSVVCSSGF